MSIINNGLLLASGADAATTYQISRSIRLNSPDSAYFSRTPSSAGNRKTFTWSGWIKRSKLGTQMSVLTAGTNASTALDTIEFTSDDKLDIYSYNGSFAYNFRTTQVFRDVGAWFHLVVALDTTNGTAGDRLKVYVNGTRITTFDTATNPGSSIDTNFFNTANAHYLGYQISRFPGDFYLADVYLLDGTATTPSTFAETDAVTGQWVPKTPTGISYGTNGFRLTFSDNSGTTSTTLGKDAAGSNNWSPNNFSVASGSGNDSLVDSPTSFGTDTAVGGEVRGNYATLNPLKTTFSGDSGNPVLSNGNLDATGISGTSNAINTIGVSSQKFYFECTLTAISDPNSFIIGLNQSSSAYSGNFGLRPSGSFVNGTITSGSAFSFTTGDTVGIAYEPGVSATFYKNNNTTSFVASLSSGQWFSWAQLGSTAVSASFNFGQRPFINSSVPSGFKALCDTNLTAPVIAKPSTVMDVKLYTGNGSTQTISGLGFSPDFVWAKSRSSAAGHGLFDSVRGVSKSLSSHVTEAEGVGAAGTGVSAFNSDGFSLGPYDAAFAGNINPSGSSQVAWAWDAGTSTVTNNNGSISSQVRANASAGFSIVTYTGNGANATVGHGLGVAPSMAIVKVRNRSGENWLVYHKSLTTPATDYLLLSSTAASGTLSGYWNGGPTSTVIGLGNYSAINSSGDTYVAYCFAPVANYSSAFSYSGTGSTDGPFCFLGFRPRLILLKVSNTTGPWYLFDTARNTYNVMNNRLEANSNAAEASDRNVIDALSNGFKLRDVDAVWNQSGNTYIGFAWAESPFQYARAR